MGGGSPNSTMIGEGFITEWFATPDTVNVKRYRQCSPGSSRAVDFGSNFRANRVACKSCDFVTFRLGACLSSYIGVASGKHVFTPRMLPAS
jgi:hypothetical protein